MAKEAGVVVVRYGSWIIDAEAVEGITEGGLLIDGILGFLKGEIGDGRCFGVRSCCCVEEGDIIFKSELDYCKREGNLPGIRG